MSFGLPLRGCRYGVDSFRESTRVSAGGRLGLSRLGLGKLAHGADYRLIPSSKCWGKVPVEMQTTRRSLRPPQIAAAS